MGASTTLRNDILGDVANNTNFDYTPLHVSLHSGNPGDDGSNELGPGGNGYTRQQAQWEAKGATADGEINTDADLEWTNMPAETVSHVGIWDTDEVFAGTFLWGGALDNSRDTNSGDTFRISSGDLTLTLT